MARTNAAQATAATAAAAASTSIWSRVLTVLGGALKLLGGPIGLVITGVALLGAALFGARNSVVEFGGRTATIGQIVVAVWDTMIEKVRAVGQWLGELVGINNLSWGRIREGISGAVGSIGGLLRALANLVIGNFHAMGSVAAVTARFMLERFRNALRDIGAVARALGTDIAAAFRGDFSMRHLRDQMKRGAGEMREFGAELTAAVRQAYNRDYVGEAAANVARRIRPQAAPRERVFAQPQAGTATAPGPVTPAAGRAGAASNLDSAQLALAQAQAQAQASLLADYLARAQTEIERALEDRLISIRDFHTRKTDLEHQAIDAEVERTRSALAEQQRLATAGDDEAARIRAKGEVAKLEAELIVLNNRRTAAAQTNARAAALAERELADALQQVRSELAEISGTATESDRRSAIERQYRDLRDRLVAQGDDSGVSLVDRLIDVKVAQSNLQTLEAAWQQSNERMRTAQQSIQIQQQAGLLTESQARQQIIALQQQSAAEMEQLLPSMERAAQAIGPEAVQRVQAWRNEIAQTKLVVDDVAVTVEGAFKDGMVSMFEAIGSGAKSAREAFADFARSVMAAIQRIAAQKLAESLFGGLFGGSAGTGTSLIGKAASWLFGVGMATGGLVRGPGTSTSDSIPARLCAGEYVVNAAAVRSVGVAFLNGINGLHSGPQWQGGALALAAGGLVPQVNVQAAQPVQQALRIVNAVDPGLTHDHLQTPAGERVIVNIITRNSRAIRNALA